MPSSTFSWRRNAPCCVPGCSHLTHGKSKYCASHKQRVLRNGDPTARALRLYELEPHRADVHRFLASNKDHKSITAACAWLDEYRAFYLPIGRIVKRGPRPKYTWQHRLGRELQRLHDAGITSLTILEVLASVFLMTERDPGRLPRFTKQHRFAASHLILNLAPRYGQRAFRSSTKKVMKTTTRLSSEVLDRFADELHRPLLRLLLGIVDAIDGMKKRETAFKAALAKTMVAVPFNASLSEAVA